MSVIRAPFTPEQVAELRRWQTSGRVHPFTCPLSSCSVRVLTPSEAGWACAGCGYEQDWAHDFMTEGMLP